MAVTLIPNGLHHSCCGFYFWVHFETDAELDMWTTLGLGAMLVANIPIMWIYGPKAMQAYHTYMSEN